LFQLPLNMMRAVSALVPRFVAGIDLVSGDARRLSRRVVYPGSCAVPQSPQVQSYLAEIKGYHYHMKKAKREPVRT